MTFPSADVSATWRRLILTSLLAAFAAHAQRPWVRQNPLPVGPSTDVYEVIAVSADTAFVLGSFGEIALTGDGGLTWRGLYAGTRATLFAACFLNSQSGWVAGDSGLIIHTADGGATWARQPSGTVRTLRDIHFPSATTGYAAGDTAILLKTVDGGAAWTPLDLGGTGDLEAVFFLTPDTGWVSGNGVIAFTHNGGASWTGQATGGSYGDVFFVNADTGWACRGNWVYRTLDGGAQWTNLAGFSLSDLIWSNAIFFHSATEGWLAGTRQVSGTNFDGVVLHSTDAGATWTRRVAFNEYLYAMSFANSDVGWCAGSSGLVAKTVDGGANWERTSRGPTGVLRDVFFAGRNQGWAVGGSAFDSTLIMHTADGGATWTEQQTPMRSVGLESVFFVDSLTGWAVGQGSTVLHTSDGGANWTSQSSGAAGDLQSVFFANRTNGWVVGGGSTQSAAMRRTTDGGANWTAVGAPVTSALNDVFFLDLLDGWVVGNRGVILRTSTGGQAWDTLSDTALGTLDNVCFTDANRGWVVGSAGIHATADGGVSWRLSCTAPGILAAHCVDSSTVYAVTGSNTTPFPGFVYRTTDAGATWQRQFLINGVIWDAGIFFADENTGWVVSQGGTILHTFTGGGTDWTAVRREATARSATAVRGFDMRAAVVPGGVRFLMDGLQPAELRLSVCNASGRAVWSRIVRADRGGRRSVLWPGDGCGKGVYFARAVLGGRLWRGRVVLSR